MQFGVNMKVFWPEGLKNLMLDEVNKLREMYLNENDQMLEKVVMLHQ